MKYGVLCFLPCLAKGFQNDPQCMSIIEIFEVYVNKAFTVHHREVEFIWYLVTEIHVALLHASNDAIYRFLPSVTLNFLMQRPQSEPFQGELLISSD